MYMYKIRKLEMNIKLLIQLFVLIRNINQRPPILKEA
jgi:hypothetical protein